MKSNCSRRLLSIALVLCLVVSLFAGLTMSVNAATTVWYENPTGYAKASDVKYVTVDKYICNWGVREETATFLSTYAENYYTGSYTFDNLSKNAGGTGTSNAPSSALYKALSSMLSSKQTYVTSYNATRDLYKYTDCMVSKYSNISSFYSGIKLNGAWDSGSTWNREHTWPNSKISGNGENDIMMLRPTSVSENSGRGNKAYGESSGYYDPNSESSSNFNVRGDCARIVLYVYVRWGQTSNMWGSAGVMESLDVLLKWMEEDPVDTWEMGRNDAVQSITGVRNVFVDYPEFAWLLFGQKVPTDYPTPSSGAVTPHTHNYVASVTAPTCTAQGYTTYTCAECGDSYVSDYVNALGHSYQSVVTDSTCTEQGYTTYTCSRCKDSYIGDKTKPLGHDFVLDHTVEPTETERGYDLYTCTRCEETEQRNFTDPTGGSVEPPVPVENPFVDVSEKNYYYNPVLWAVEKGITTGTSATRFSPDAGCSRAQVVTFLWRANGKPAPKSDENPFTDVAKDQYYYNAVLWAVENGITTGTSTTRFSPEATCTRAQVVTFLWRSAGEPEIPTVNGGDADELPILPECPFTDVSSNSYYYTAMMWAVANGVTTGTTTTRFSPDATCVRAQVVTFLYRAQEQ